MKLVFFVVRHRFPFYVAILLLGYDHSWLNSKIIASSFLGTSRSFQCHSRLLADSKLPNKAFRTAEANKLVTSTGSTIDGDDNNSIAPDAHQTTHDTKTRIKSEQQNDDEQKSLVDRHNNNHFHSSSLWLYFEFSPLIGGPSFLPIHVKVVLASVPNIGDDDDDDDDKQLQYFYHKWDFVPINPTNPEVIQTLLRFAPVLGDIRYQHYNTTTTGSKQSTPSSISSSTTLLGSLHRNTSPPLVLDFPNKTTKTLNLILFPLRINIRSKTLATTKNDHDNDVNFEDGNSSSNDSRIRIELTDIVVERANLFCKQYDNRNLHLITNNCWTFAWALYQDLLSTTL